MKKIVIILIAITALVVLAVAGFFWYSMSQPLYRPGMVREGKNLGTPLAPGVQTGGENSWTVEPGIQLWHFSQGQGKQALIIHGGPGYPYLQPWTGLKSLAGQYRFHYYDQRGCGKSTRPIDRFDSQNTYQNMLTLDRTLGLGAQIADIERIRQLVGEEKLVLIGHSWGGFLAALYAAEFPEHVAALILVSPANTLVMPQPDPGSDLFASVRARLPEAQRAEYDAFVKAYMDFGSLFTKSEADLVALNRQFERYFQAAYGTSLPEQGEPGGWMVWAMYMSMGTRHDYRPALRQVSAPVLVLHGAQDLQSEAASRLYADAFPNAEFTVIPNAGHFTFEEQPVQFEAAVTSFLNKVK